MATDGDNQDQLKFEKLHGVSNWSSWKFNMKMALIDKDLWSYVQSPPPATGYAVGSGEERKSFRALARIGLALDLGQQLHIRSCNNGHEAWLKLQGIYDTKDAASQLSRRQVFFSMHMRVDEPVNAWLSRVAGEAAECQGIGCAISEMDIVSVTLNGLTETFHTTRRVLLAHAAVSGRALALVEVQRALIDDEMSTIVASGESPSAFWTATRNKSKPKVDGTKADGKAEAPKSKNRKGDVCFWCGVAGHREPNCRQKADGVPRSQSGRDALKTLRGIGSKKDGQDKDEGAKALTSTITFSAVVTGLKATTHQSGWFLDSGANEHIITDRNRFITYEVVKDVSVALAGKDQGTPVTGRGTARFTSIVNNDAITIELKNACHVPNASANLVSLGSLVERGANVEFGRTLRVRAGKRLVIESHMKNRMWAIKVEGVTDTSSERRPSALLAKVEAASLQTWHQRLGHISADRIRQLQSMADGIKVNSDGFDATSCHGCQVGKGHRDPFPPSESRADTPFALVHADLAGPMQIRTVEGGRYLVLFIDDYTRLQFISITTHKSDAYQVLMELKSAIERQTDHKLRAFRSDNDSVFTKKVAQAWFKKEGIRHEKTVPYTPSSNGVAERAIRSTVEAAKAMLHNTCTKPIDERLWGEACRLAVYLQNRTPHKITGDQTPFQLFYGNKPNLSNLRTFGTPSYIHVPKERRETKFSPHRQLVIFVGYPEGVKGWKFFNPNSSSFIVARDVTFLEHSTPELVVLDDHDGTEEGERFEEVDDLAVSDKSAAHARRDTISLGNRLESAANEESSAPDKSVVHEPSDASVEGPRGQSIAEGVRRDTRLTSRLESGAKPTRTQPTRTQRPRSQWSTGLQALHAVIIPKSYDEAMTSPEVDSWKEACVNEMAAINANHTWALVDLPSGRKAIETKWVFDLKLDNQGNITRYKARLVAKGFRQIANVDYFDTYAPVARYASIRTVLAMAAIYDLEILQIDAVTAFLNGELTEEVYVQQPQGFVDVINKHQVCHLQKAIYGLKQAGYTWAEMLRQILLKHKFNPTTADPCVYTRGRDKDLIILMVYVDDIMILASSLVIGNKLIDDLEHDFKLKRIPTVNKYVGFEIERDRKTHQIYLRQHLYTTDTLKRFGMIDSKPVGTPMEVNAKLDHGDSEPFDKTTYQALIGHLTYLSMTTRPDIAQAASALGRYNAAPRDHHWMHAKRVLRYLRGTVNAALVLGGSNTTLTGYSDASFGNDQDTGRSVTGYAFMVGQGVVSWSSKRQASVALSTTEAEYMAATSSAQEAIWLSTLLTDLGEVVPMVNLYGDNHGSLALSATTDFHPRTKHINIRFHFIKEAVKDGLVNYVYLSTDQLPADALTKPLSLAKHKQFFEALGMDLHFARVGVLE